MNNKIGFDVNEAHIYFAKQVNGRTWELLGKKSRTQGEDEEMIHAAHTSLYHWLQVGTGAHHQRGEWMVSHVYAIIGLGQAALRHAKRCQSLTEEHKSLLGDFDFGYANEALARAYAVLGKAQSAAKYYKLAEEIGQNIADEEDRSWFMGDLQSGDWHGALD
jgi:hypothetical protein